MNYKRVRSARDLSTPSADPATRRSAAPRPRRKGQPLERWKRPDTAISTSACDPANTNVPLRHNTTGRSATICPHASSMGGKSSTVAHRPSRPKNFYRGWAKTVRGIIIGLLLVMSLYDQDYHLDHEQQHDGNFQHKHPPRVLVCAQQLIHLIERFELFVDGAVPVGEVEAR